jgi:hypothetical protein
MQRLVQVQLLTLCLSFFRTWIQNYQAANTPNESQAAQWQLCAENTSSMWESYQFDTCFDNCTATFCPQPAWSYMSQVLLLRNRDELILDISYLTADESQIMCEWTRHFMGEYPALCETKRGCSSESKYCSVAYQLPRMLGPNRNGERQIRRPPSKC